MYNGTVPTKGEQGAVIYYYQGYSLVFLPCGRDRCVIGKSQRERTKFLIISFSQIVSYYVLLYHRISWVGRDSQQRRSLKFISWGCIGLPQQSHHVPEIIVQILFVLCQSWYCDHFPGESVPVPSCPVIEKPFSNI